MPWNKMGKYNYVYIHASRFPSSLFRSRKNFSTTYATVLFFSPYLSIKISNFSRNVRNIVKISPKKSFFDFLKNTPYVLNEIIYSQYTP